MSTKILVIEDESILREEVVEWLMLEGYATLAAADGQQGLELALQSAPDLVICDIMMPRLDGHGVLLALRADPTTADIPFIFMTARAAYEDIRQGMDMGADDYLTKPFTRQQFFQAIATRLHKQSLLAQRYQQSVEQWQNAFEQEHAQRLLKARLVAMFSHDFRNPLNAIHSAVELLRDYGDRLEPGRRLRYFNRIEASVLELLNMLDDMLVVSQIESGNLGVNPEEIDLRQFLKTIVEEFQIIHGDVHPLVFTSNFGAPFVADPRLLRQIAGNLISNAIKYSPKGSQVQVRLERQPGHVVLTVIDHGIGIPEADQAHLFTPFQRASNAANVSGTGLGLAIVKQAIDLHGGTVTLQSQVGVGTTVKVELPG